MHVEMALRTTVSGDRVPWAVAPFSTSESDAEIANLRRSSSRKSARSARRPDRRFAGPSWPRPPCPRSVTGLGAATRPGVARARADAGRSAPGAATRSPRHLIARSGTRLLNTDSMWAASPGNAINTYIGKLVEKQKCFLLLLNSWGLEGRGSTLWGKVIAFRSDRGRFGAACSCEASSWPWLKQSSNYKEKK